MVYSPPQKLRLTLHPDFQADLLALKTRDLNAAAEIIILLESFKDNQSTLADLMVHRHVIEGNFPVEVQKWVKLYEQGLNLWRLKFLDLGSYGRPYRLVYAFDPSEFCFHFLAIAPREFNYEPSHPMGVRITAAYEKLRSS